MKYLVISDVHGNIEYARLIPEIIEREKPSNIVLLGDLFSYYGDSEEIIDIYNRYAGITIGIKGNNDSPYCLINDTLNITRGIASKYTKKYDIEYMYKVCINV